MKNVELKNYKTHKGHDGMRGINADIHYKGKKIATVYDDAMGGCFDYNILGRIDTKERTENKVLFAEMEKENGFKANSMELDFAISELCSVLDRKKDEKKGVLVKSQWGYDVIGFNVTIPTAIKKYSNGLTELQKVYDEQVKTNKVVLNKDYLKSQGIKI